MTPKHHLAPIIGYRKNGIPIRLAMGGDKTAGAGTGVEILPELRGKDAGDISPTGYPEELRGKTPEELAQFVEVLDAHLRSIHQTDEGELRDKTPEEQKAFAYGLKVRDLAITRIEEDRAVKEVFRRRPKAVQQAMAAIEYKSDDPFGDVRRMTVPEARDSALKKLDDRASTAHLRSDQKDELEKQIRKSTDIARRILVTETDDYRSAWQKLVTDPHPILTPEENRAVQAFYEYRAMSEGTTTAGGFGIPVFIDPSIILTAQGTDNPFLTLARQVDVNTNAWKGVSSAGVTWHFNYAEGSAVSDDSPTLAQPTVNVYMARGFLPYSIELGQDYPGFADEMATLLSAGYDELLVNKFTAGAGAGSLEPTGILTALSANTNVRVALTTAGTMGAGDPYKTWQALPQRFRRKASWLMSVATNNQIRQLGTANVYHAFTVNLPQDWADTLFRRAVYESPYMSDFTTSTSSTAGIAVVGDFSNYVVARRGGMSVELIPMLFDVTNNRPTGQRGWFAYARVGGGSANDLGFRLMTNS
jgi:HK97 family phage major capsid protein